MLSALLLAATLTLQTATPNIAETSRHTETSGTSEAPSPPASPGPDVRSVPVEALFPFWPEYLALQDNERDQIDLRYKLTLPAHPEGGAYGIWLQRDAQSYELIEQGERGLVTPPELQAFQDGLEVVTDAPPGQSGVSLEIQLNQPLSETYAIDELEAAIEQAQSIMRKLAGWRAMVMPRFDTVMFIFEGPAPKAELNGAEQEALTLETIEYNTVYFKPGQRRYRGFEYVELGQTPIAVIITAVG